MTEARSLPRDLSASPEIGASARARAAALNSNFREFPMARFIREPAGLADRDPASKVIAVRRRGASGLGRDLTADSIRRVFVKLSFC